MDLRLGRILGDFDDLEGLACPGVRSPHACDGPFDRLCSAAMDFEHDFSAGVHAFADEIGNARLELASNPVELERVGDAQTKARMVGIETEEYQRFDPGAELLRRKLRFEPGHAIEPTIQH